MEINGKTKLVGILGREISYTLSPKMHNYAFKKLNLDYSYIPMDIGFGKGNLRDAIRFIRVNSNFVGANVTIPFKMNVAKYLDGEISKLACEIGAINTIVKKNGKLNGDNTDVDGFLDSLRQKEVNLTGKYAVLLGSGGTARAIAYALLSSNISHLVIMSRTPANGIKLLRKMKKMFKEMHITFKDLYSKDLEGEIQKCDILVTTIPKGLSQKVLGKIEKSLKTKTFVFDVNYRKQTRLLKIAKLKGASHQNGLAMLINQGARSFSMWTGKKHTPVKLMQEALSDVSFS